MRAPLRFLGPAAGDGFLPSGGVLRAQGFSPEDVQRYLERIVEVRGVTMESLNLYRDRIVELAGSKSPDVLKAGWNARYISRWDS